MSLTSHLANPRSPVCKFIRENFPLVRFSLKQEPALFFATKKLLGILDIPREPACKPMGDDKHARLVGTAIDYRIRYYFKHSPFSQLIAAHGAEIYQKWGWMDLAEKLFFEEKFAYWEKFGKSLTPKLDQEIRSAANQKAKSVLQRMLKKFARSLEHISIRFRPEKRRLSRSQEEILAAYCAVLAHLETFYRNELGAIDMKSPLKEIESDRVTDLLELMNPYVEDMVTLSWAFEEDEKALFELPALLNPTFKGSTDVGGADADLIISDTLFEIKTFSKLYPSLFRAQIYQLLGYVLLDYSDHYRIRNIGIFFTRHRKRWVKPLWWFLFPLDELIEYLDSSQTPSETLVKQNLNSIRELFRAQVLPVLRGGGLRCKDNVSKKKALIPTTGNPSEEIIKLAQRFYGLVRRERENSKLNSLTSIPAVILPEKTTNITREDYLKERKKRYYKEYRQKRKALGNPISSKSHSSGSKMSAEYYREYRERRKLQGNPIKRK